MSKKYSNSIKRKLAVTINVVLVIQALLIGGIGMPQKAEAANYIVPVSTQKTGEEILGFAEMIVEDSVDGSIAIGETLSIDTFNTSSIDDNEVHEATLKIKYKTGPDYDGTGSLSLALQDEELMETSFTPITNATYSTRNIDLVAAGIDTKLKLQDLNVQLDNNSTVGLTDANIYIDSIWVDLKTSELPTMTLTASPLELTNLKDASFSWEGLDDTTDPSLLSFAYRLDGGALSAYGTETSVSFSDLEDGLHTFEYWVKDGDTNEVENLFIWEIDSTKPIFTTKTTPTSANQKTKEIKIVISSNEDLKQVAVPVSTQGKKVYALGPNYGVKLTINDDAKNPTVAYLPKGKDGKYTYEYLLEVKAEQKITFQAVGTDLAGNQTVKAGNFSVDNIAPAKVVNLKAVASNSKVVLTWTNPKDKDFAGVRILKNGIELTKSVSNIKTLADSNVVNGKDYSYEVYAYDNSGNRSEKSLVKASPVAPVVTIVTVVPAVAVAEVPVEAKEVTVVETPKEEIKAATDEQEPTDEKETEVKNEKKFPTWGILFLLILAAIGGYLFYVQKPEPPVIPLKTVKKKKK